VVIAKVDFFALTWLEIQRTSGLTMLGL